MFRCNQCPEIFDDRSAIKRHLSIKHFNYFPYSCKICKKAGENHTTATEDDMDKHIDALHQVSDYNMILLKNFGTEDKINAVIEECQLPISQSTSRDFKNNLQNGSNAPNNQSLSHESVTESGSTLSHVAQEQNNGNMIENMAADNIESVFESVPKIKDEVTDPKNINLCFKDALRQVYDVLGDETTVDISAKEIDCSSSEMNQELSNDETTRHITADGNDEFHRKIIEKVTVQRESSINLLENTLPELQSFRGTPIMSNETQPQAKLNSTAVSDKTFNQIDEQNIRHDSTPNQSTSVPLPPAKENVFPNKQNVDKELSKHVAIKSAIQTRQRSSANNSSAKLIPRKRTLPKNDRYSRTKLSSNRPNPKQTNGTKKLHKCNHCAYASAEKSSLHRHMRTHTGEKPFKCGHCPFACTQKSDLNIHVRTHTGEKPYKCNVCPYACAQSGALKNHIMTHTGEKPRKCSQCAYAAVQSGQLRQHVRHHHSKKTE